MAAKHTQPLVSVIVPCCSDEAFVSNCIESILRQTYRNVEIIIVNNGSSGDIKSTVASYQQEHGNMKYIDLGQDRGLFRARLEGFKASIGDYIISVDDIDSISVDYIRTMVSCAEEKGSDIVIPETVIEDNNEKFIFNLANDLPFDELDGNECLDRFFEQQGENYMWHRVAAPLYSKRIVDAAVALLDSVSEHIVMGEDVLFSVHFWSYAQRVNRSTTSYYYQHEQSRVDNSSYELLKKKIADINIVADKVADFLKKQGAFARYEKEFYGWMNLYSLNYRKQINDSTSNDEIKIELASLIGFGDEKWDKKSTSLFLNITTSFNDGLENLKLKILNQDIEYVSFDIFDTLVTRPFMRPSDLFYLLGNYFTGIDKKFRLESFHNIRVKSEELARLEQSDNEDVSIDQIYEFMQKEYFVDEKVAQLMLSKELEYEIKYCTQRTTAKELYDLALYLGKKIIITSDMYLPETTIKAILDNCGYNDYRKLYISSQHGKMKATKNLYRHITSDLVVSPERILHIGDNYESDVVAATSASWEAAFFPKATEAMPDIFNRIFRDSAYYAQGHLGITTSYAIAMNKYFDNPFRSFFRDSNYNGSPHFMGYFALGLSLVGFTKWMVEDAQEKNIKSIIFLSRDGHLPMQVFDIFQQRLDLSIKSHYLPTSRKATIPLSIFGEANAAEIRSFNYRGQITDSILASLKEVKKVGSDDKSINIDYRKVKQLQAAFVNTYQSYFNGRVGIMDVGYSGRPEQIFSKLYDTSIDTYFLYTGNDEAKRRLGKNVNIYSRLNAPGLREKMISEIAPSCISYKVAGDSVEPIFDRGPDVSYFEKYILSEMQRGAKIFTADYLRNFSSHLSELEYGDHRLAMQPLDQATVYPLSIDKEMFRGLIHEDDIAGDTAVDIYDTFYNNSPVEEVVSYAENSSLIAELESHMGIKRSARLLAGNIKRRIIHGKNR